MPLTLEQLRRACPAAPAVRLAQELTYFNASLDEANAVTPERVAMLLTHTLHETGELRRFEENMNYSAEALCRTWPKRFSSLAAAAFAHKPEHIANRVYADRMGNGDEASGDGWKFRGRGSLQITGFDNYAACRKYLGVDFLSMPELAAAYAYRYRVGAWYWRSHGLNELADARDLEASTRVIQGGASTVPQRQAVLGRVLVALGIVSA
jgi:putative chitinase